MPRPRRFLFLFLAAVVVGLAVAGWMLLPQPTITYQGFQKIEHGMRLADVEAVMGGPPRDETTGAVVIDRSQDIPSDFPDGAFIEFRDGINACPDIRVWKNDRVAIQIAVDQENRVEDKICVPLRPASQRWLDMIRRWLGL